MPIETTDFAFLDRAFAENSAALLTLPLPSGGALSTPYFRAANPHASLASLNICAAFDGDAAAAAGLDVGAELARALRHLESAAAGFVFLVTPLSTPGGGALDARLVRDHGLSLVACPAVMAVRREELHARGPPPLPQGYEVHEVVDAATARAFADVLFEARGLDRAAALQCAEAYACGAGLAHRPALRHFVAHAPASSGSRGPVVATASAWSHAGVVSVSNVATLPAHRRRGLASALVRTAALAGEALSGVAVLQATPRAVALCRRLGWRVAGSYRVYGPASLARAGDTVAAGL